MFPWSFHACPKCGVKDGSPDGKQYCHKCEIEYQKDMGEEVREAKRLISDSQRLNP